MLVRLRPCAVGEATALITKCPKSLSFTAGQEESEYHFDSVLSPATSQRLVYGKIKPLVDFALEGGRASIISYGQVSHNYMSPLHFSHDKQCTGKKTFSFSHIQLFNLTNSCYTITEIKLCEAYLWHTILLQHSSQASLETHFRDRGMIELS